MPRVANSAGLERPGFRGQVVTFGCNIRDGFMSALSFTLGLFYVRPQTALTFMSSFTLWLGGRLRIGECLRSVERFCFFRFDDEGVQFDDDDNIEDFFGSRRGGSKLLGRYTVADCESIIRKAGIGSALQSRGISDWYVDLDLADPFLHYAYVMSRSIVNRDQYLAHIIVDSGSFKMELPSGSEVVQSRFPFATDILHIRWLSLQDPLGKFTPSRPRLPGQRYPGSSLGRPVLGLICKLAVERGRDGLVNVPEHFHNAFLYENFKFLNPDDEGRFQRLSCDLKSDIKERGLAMVSWAICLGFLRCAGEKVLWDMREQMLPLSDTLKLYFTSKQYLAAVETKRRSTGPFTIRWDQEETRTLAEVLRC
jgi:hypothetical protein